MLKILRLTSDNLRNFSLFQFSKLLNKSNVQHISANETFKSTMSKTDDIDDTPTKQTPITQTTKPNLNGMVKFFELLGNLKVSEIFFFNFFFYRFWLVSAVHSLVVI